MQNCKRCDKLLDDEVVVCPACGTNNGRKRSVWGNVLTPSASKPDVLPNDTTLPSFRQEAPQQRSTLPPPQLGQPLPPQFQPRQPNQSKKTLAIVVSVLTFSFLALIPIFRLAEPDWETDWEADQYDYVYDWEQTLPSFDPEEDEAYKRSCLAVDYNDLMDAPEIYSTDLSVRVEGIVRLERFCSAGEELYGETLEEDVLVYVLEGYSETSENQPGRIAAVLPYEREDGSLEDEFVIFYGEFRRIFETIDGDRFPVINARLCQRAETLIE